MDSFEQVCEAYYDRVFRFLLSLTGDRHRAEDLTQEVFYRALSHIGQYRESGSMYTWLCTIGKNAWLNERRKGGRYVPLEEARGAVPGPETAYEARERRQQVRRAVAELPEDYRDVVILHVYGGVPLQEIARERGRSESWGKVTYYRARQQLAQKLEGET